MPSRRCGTGCIHPTWSCSPGWRAAGFAACLRVGSRLPPADACALFPQLEIFEKLEADAFRAEWKWDGIRVQAISFEGVTRLYSRTGEDVSGAFPDLVAALAGMEAAIDGELLVLIDGRVQSFNVLQQRLNRKAVSNALLTRYPAHLRAYDLLAHGG